jgi:hypothetical protein
MALLAANAGPVPVTTIKINLKTNQVRSKLRQALKLSLGKPILDGDIFSLNPSKLGQLLSERIQEAALPEAVLATRKPMRGIFPVCCAYLDFFPCSSDRRRALSTFPLTVANSPRRNRFSSEARCTNPRT